MICGHERIRNKGKLKEPLSCLNGEAMFTPESGSQETIVEVIISVVILNTSQPHVGECPL